MLRIVRWVLLTVVQLPVATYYNSSPSDCIIGAICNKNKNKNALLVNKTIYLAGWAAVIAWVGARAPILSSAARWVAATPVFTDRTGTQPLQHHNHSLQA